MRIQSLVPELMVRDVERAVSFYVTYLGFKVLDKIPKTGVAMWARLANGSEQLMLQAETDMIKEIPHLSQQQIGGSMVLVFRFASPEPVRDLYRQLSRVTTVLMNLRDTDYRTTEFAVADPDGYIIFMAGGE